MKQNEPQVIWKNPIGIADYCETAWACTMSNSVSIEKVSNGYIVTTNNDKFVFSLSEYLYDWLYKFFEGADGKQD